MQAGCKVTALGKVTNIAHQMVVVQGMNEEVTKPVVLQVVL